MLITTLLTQNGWPQRRLGRPQGLGHQKHVSTSYGQPGMDGRCFHFPTFLLRRCSFPRASYQSLIGKMTPLAMKEVPGRFHLLSPVWLNVWLFLLSVIWGEKGALLMGWKQDSVCADLLVIMMMISILCSTYTFQQAVTPSHYIISFTRVLGCQHFTDEKAEMNPGIHCKRICLVTLLISWVEGRCVPKSRSKGLSVGWTATLRV